MVKEITDANFNETLATGKPVVVDFWAEWCGPCKMMSPVIDELADQFDGRIIVGKCNVDDSEDVPAEFGIMSIPTVLFFKNGQLVNKQVGYCDKSKILPLFEALL